MAESSTLARDRIINKTSRVFGVSKEDIRSERRDREAAHARASAAYLLRSQTKHTLMGQMSFPRIGIALGPKEKPRDHTTIMHYVEQVERATSGHPKAVASYDKKFRKLHSIAAHRSRPKMDVPRDAEVGDVGFEPVL